MPDNAQTGVLYMRKWKISIYKPTYETNDKGETVRSKDQDTEMDVSLLRCVFKTSYSLETPASQIATLVVYNMNADTEKAIIEEGFQIEIEGGYEQGQYGHIFTGDIVQVIRNREDGIDYRLEILAIRGMMPYDMNFSRATLAAQSTPRERVEAVCKNADVKIPVGNVSENLNQQPLPRGKVFFGTPGKYLRDIAIENNAHFGLNDEGKTDVACLTDEIPEDKVLYLTPTTGLVGTPRYTDNGIQIKMLLEPRIRLECLIKIDNEIIQRQLVSVSNTDKGPKINGVNQNLHFEKSGEYRVLSFAHSMDTWGDEWTTEVVACSQAGRQSLVMMMGNAKQNVL